MIVVDLTPMVDGYCANLARTFVLGEPDPQQRALLEAYATLLPVVRDAMCPGATVTHLDAAARGSAPRARPRPEHQVILANRASAGCATRMSTA